MPLLCSGGVGQLADGRRVVDSILIYVICKYLFWVPDPVSCVCLKSFVTQGVIRNAGNVFLKRKYAYRREFTYLENVITFW